MKPGRFITVEGTEGVGKTTQLLFVLEWLQKKDLSVIKTREPGGTPLGERIRELVLDTRSQLSDETELLLIFAARSDHWRNKIQPSLNQGTWVLSDRFTDASYAYQGGGRGVGVERIQQLEELVLGNVRPDLTLLLDMPLADASSRVDRRGDKDRFEQEQLEFFVRVRNAYLERADRFPERIKVINAGVSIDEVRSQIFTRLEQFWASLE